MRMVIGGREYDVPEDSTGNVDVVEARRIANIPDSRMLIRQNENGANHIMPTSGKISASPYDRFTDTGRAVRGDKK